MLGLRRTSPLAEVPPRRDGASRPGAVRRAELDAYFRLLDAVGGAGVVSTTGPDRLAVALGLATAATVAGRRTALLECDLNGPALARALGLSPRPGFSEYLGGTAGAGEILQPLVAAGPASRNAAAPLVCVVAGTIASPTATALASERCREALRRLRSAYDLLAICGPPLGAERDALAQIAAEADATLLCARGGELPKRPPSPVTGLVAVA
jgi:Mrp family chromosome partitioning ATPase